MKKKLRFKVLVNYPFTPHKIGDIVDISSNEAYASELLKYPDFFEVIEPQLESTKSPESPDSLAEKRSDNPHHYNNRVD